MRQTVDIDGQKVTIEGVTLGATPAAATVLYGDELIGDMTWDETHHWRARVPSGKNCAMRDLYLDGFGEESAIDAARDILRWTVGDRALREGGVIGQMDPGLGRKMRELGS